MNYEFKIYFTTEAELDNFIKSNGGIPCGECVVQATEMFRENQNWQ
jgi:hypothetical protein